MYGKLLTDGGDVYLKLGNHHEDEILEGYLCHDHVHMLIPILAEYSVAQGGGFIKRKSAIHIAREFQHRTRGFAKQCFEVRGCFVLNIGREEKVSREYIRKQK